MSDKLFKGQTTAAMLAQYFYYQTPQFVFYIMPLTVLIAGMVTIGILTKNSEIVVMQACGISLYRVAVPLIVFAVVASGADVPDAGAGAAPTRTAAPRRSGTSSAAARRAPSTSSTGSGWWRATATSTTTCSTTRAGRS